MNRIKSIALSLLGAGALVSAASAQEEAGTRCLRIFDEAVFYDGYNGTVFDAGLEDGILRHANHLYAKRLTDAELDWFGDDLRMNVTVGALCDNYDRIGNINIAFVPKGEETYDPYEVQRIEIGRFITPFFNKNKEPSAVPYEYENDALSLVFRDATLREKYDFWVEFELFGVPYAANQQVSGCAGRNDVFTGTLEMFSDSEPASATNSHVLVPIVMKKPESKGHNLNNYSEQGTDTIGTCTKTYRFNVESDMTDARITLITSNHGANANGEEYVRRKHLVYIDGELAHVYVPGGKSCEPYRKYNTQSNGIYGYSWHSESWWTNWNNWCPGDAIPVRTLNLGAYGSGTHEVMIRVPDAEFADSQGDFPVSMYFQGLTEGELPSAGFAPIEADGFEMDLKIKDGMLTFSSEAKITEVEVYDMAGNLCFGTRRTDTPVNLRSLTDGVYLVVATAGDGRLAYRKVRI